ncbi:RNA-binding (RRM/RBD/RNP motifs) family protein [Actinidia rufa]|uniref:RNA-binding (RRM/RBD/RNP motifs) family protein n=1 Tax=Actinidia rufa TaxID=165716 RepID=A0A7J0D8V7_9ERIC|nr:RNA-binding (RRM/RBD/RNP motifs) family protein [Actinidia rufa]
MEVSFCLLCFIMTHFHTRTVKVSNVSLGATLQDVMEFFSFSGDIEYVEMRSDTERSQIAFVTFKDSQGAETAALLSVRLLLFTLYAMMGWQVIQENIAFKDITVQKKKNVVANLCPRELGGQASLHGPHRSKTPALSLGRPNASPNKLEPNFSSQKQPSMDEHGATIVDLSVNITPDPDYQLPPAASAPPLKAENKTAGGSDSALRKAEDVVTGMLAKGFVLGKDAVNKAKSFDEKHQLTSTATAKVASFDKKIGLTEKISVGTSVVNEKVREVDQKFQVSEKAKSAFSAAEQTVSSAGSAVMKNRYVLTGATWVTGAFSKVVKAAGEVGQKTKEKVGMAEDEQRRKMVDDYAQIHLSESPKSSTANEQQPSKPAPAQGLIL